MRIVIQRVSEASVNINGHVFNSIQTGLLVLLGICADDTSEDVAYLCKKILSLRIFQDASNKMNLALDEVRGEILLISQFTLYANTKKGNRPSFVSAARPEFARPLYDNFIGQLAASIGTRLKTGSFGADMKVSLVNNGPVTILIDSKEKE